MAITFAFILVFSDTLTLFCILLLRVLGPGTIAFNNIKERIDNVQEAIDRYLIEVSKSKK